MNKLLFYIQENIKEIILSILVLIALVFSSISLFYKFDMSDNSYNENSLAYNLNEKEKEEVNTNFFVEIKGAVKKPGVYEASNNEIINDIIKKADGLLNTAYIDNINLAKKVTSEMVIYIFSKNEYKAANTKTIVKVKEVCSSKGFDISSCTDKKESVIVPTENNDNTNEQSVKEEDKNSNEVKIININTATLNELMTISGIGSSKANEIINYRNTKGSFKSIDEIKNVKGIGDSIFEKIKNYITV